ncbi:MAG: acetylxylan esterase [Chloroflexota bacterium]|nr:acetylxylan esterase [Chloroflexota bacterium]
MDMTRNGYQHMVLDDYVDRVRRIRRQRRARLEAIETPEQASAYRQRVSDAINRAFLPRPSKTPLNARVTGVIGRSAFRIEKITFESRPGCLVTANLYLPRNLQEPAPCVLGTCGHSEPGKACDLYQGFCQRLAHAGFVVLIYDPFSQGERDQYRNSGVREQVGWGTRAHNMMGKQLELLGEFFGFWRAWDGIRALDYLLGRPEVDPTRVGLTGNSGGGTMTTWLWAVEDRFTMAAPSCFVTTFLHNLENELPADAEQCPPGVIGAGLEMADFLIASAPKPVLLLGQTYDYFDRRGLREAYEDVRAFYELLNASDAADLFIGPQGHGYSIHNQQAMVEFFCKHAEVPVVQVDEVEELPEEELFATPNGQVVDAGAMPIYEMIASQARELESQREPLDGEALRGRLRQLLSLSDQRLIPHYRVLRPVRGEEVIARFAVETEGPIRAILRKVLAAPVHPFTLDVDSEIRLYLPHVSAEADLAEDEWAGSLKEDLPLYALDVRGLGESLPEEERDGFFQPYGMDYMFHAYGLMLGRSYLGRRVHDVLSVIDLLAHEGAEQIHLYGRGQGAILALLAALFHDQVASVTLQGVPNSFLEWTQTPLVAWPAANFIRGILQVCDLPDCIRALNGKVEVIERWGATMEPILESLPREGHS